MRCHSCFITEQVTPMSKIKLTKMHIYAFTYVYIFIFSSWTLSDLQIDGVRSLSLSLFCEALVLAISTEMISNVNIWHWKKPQHAHTHTQTGTFLSLILNPITQACPVTKPLSIFYFGEHIRYKNMITHTYTELHASSWYTPSLWQLFDYTLGHHMSERQSEQEKGRGCRKKMRRIWIWQRAKDGETGCGRWESRDKE